MTVRLHIQNGIQVIIPIRFQRTNFGGGPDIASPDLDDRGYAMPRAGSLNSTTARGPMFGITVGDTVNVKIVRTDLDSAAALFATVSASGSPQFRITSPAAGTQIPADGIITLEGLADTSVGQKLEIRFGAPTGPIIAEAEPHVFSLRTLNVTPHLCTIHSAPALPGTGVVPGVGGSPLDVARVFTLARAIWRPAGVDLNVGAVQAETYLGFGRDDFAPRGGGPIQEGGVVSQNRINATCNVYFIRFMDTSLGVGINREGRAAEGWTHPGIIVAVEGSLNPATGVITRRTGSADEIFQQLGNDLAHEIGHFLTLSHADRVNSPGRPDTYCRKQLMHPNNLLPGAAVPLQNAADNNDVRFDDIGYGVVGGRGHRGCLLTLKNYSTHASDGETSTARRRFASPNLT